MTILLVICIVAQLACTIALGIRNERLHEENGRLIYERNILNRSLEMQLSINNPVAEHTSEHGR